MINEIEYSKVMKNNPSAAEKGLPRKWSRVARQAIACGAMLVGLGSAMAQIAISTLAGSSPSIASGNVDGTGTAARFNAPQGVAVDASGNIYIADTSNHKIRKVTAAGVVSTLAGTGSAGDAVAGPVAGTVATFRFPGGLATDGTNIYVADTFNHVIRKVVIADGTTSTLAGTAGSFGTTTGLLGVGKLNNPLGVAISGTDLYVADTSNHAVRKIVIATGEIFNFAGTPGTSGSTDDTGLLARFKNPGAIAADGSGNLYVADTANHTIRKIVIAGGGVVSTHAGTASLNGGSSDSTGSSASFKSPGGIVVSGTSLFVADTGNSTIRQIGIVSQTVTTIAGSAGAVGTADAIGTLARFQGPQGIGANAAGTLYIADTNNHTVRSAGAAVAPTVSNPTDAGVTAGSNPTFTVTVSGNPTPSIQWERQAANTTGFSAITNGSVYSGVTTTTLTVTNVTSGMSGDKFRATVSNGVGSAVSSAIPATLTVQQAPAITSAATASFSVNVAGSFRVIATGSPAPTFTISSGSFPPWASLDRDTGVISGAPSNNTSSPFNFTIQASNGVGTPATQSITISVQNGATISTQPINAAVSPGGTASFGVVASGTPSTFTYQWYRNAGGVSGFSLMTDVGGTYLGTTSSTLTIYNASQGMNGDQFQVVVSNGIGSAVTSSIATLTIAVAPQITSANSTIFAVNTANSFHVQATGSPAPTFSIVAGSLPTTWTMSLNSNTGEISGVPINDTGTPFNFTIRAGNGIGVFDQSFSLSVTPAGAFAAFTTHPLSQSVSIGSPVAFTVVATGSPAPTYQWQRQSSAGGGFINVVDGGVFSGATTATLSISAANTSLNGEQFQCIATNTVNSAASYATSNIATLTVNVGTIITTIAGSPGVSATVDGTGTGAQFSNPYSVAVDASGTFYVADPSAHVIRKVTAGGVVTTFAGTAGVAGSVDGVGAAARFNGPQGVAVDGSGNVYVADTNNHTIRGISQNGTVLTLAGTAGSVGSVDGLGAAARFNYPYGLVIDSFGTIYVSDTFNHMIRRVALNGTVSTMAGTAGVRGTTDGTGAGARFAYPTGIAVDAQAFVYVADSQNGTIRKINQGNTVTTYAGTPGSFGTADGAALTVARFNQPNGVAVDSTGVVYVADTFSHTIRRITTAGEVGTLAGLAGSVGATDGTGSAARFNQPNGIAVDTAGNVYIADSQNRTIRRSGAVTAPTITSQPVNASTAPGSNATFSVAATGAPLPTVYQWQRMPADGSTGFVNLVEGGVYGGTNSATLTVYNVQSTMNNDQFHVIVSNYISPDVTSNAVTLSTVVAAPIITSLASTSFKATELGAFTVTASGNPAPTFSLSGQPSWLSINTSTGTLSGTAPDTSGSPFTFTITANNGAVVNQTFTLTVNPAVVAPAITVQPVGGTIARGQTANFSVTATGTEPLIYQWKKDGVAISGATSSRLVIASAQAGNGGGYSVTVTNGADTATSGVAFLLVNAPPVITVQPTAQTALAGGTVTFTVAATGTPAPSYQWRANGQVLLGATSSTLTLSNVQTANAANYDVLVNNGVGGLVSSLAQLTVSASASAPVITASPTPRTVVVGSSTTLTVGVSAAPAPIYQWRKGGVNITGATGPVFTFANIGFGDSANYDVVVSNSAGSATSSPAAVTVIGRSYAGTYFGSFGGNAGNFALSVRGDNTGTFLGYLPGTFTGLRNLDLSVSDTGAFSFVQGTVAVSGNIAANGNITGTVIGVNGATLTGSKSSDSGSTAGASGLYQAAAANTSSTAYAIVGGSGQAFILVQTSVTTDGGQGTVDGNNRVTLSTVRQSIIATIAPDTLGLSLTVTSTSGTTTFTGASESVLATQRLANISTRARVGTGDAVTIAGFVISGQDSKPVLIRAIGPALGSLGVSTALTAPKLELFRSGNNTPIATNTGWTTSGNTSGITAATIAAGAFPLGANAADSVIFATLAPGAYTAVISSANNTPGVALAEVYDLSAPAAGQKLFNISTRASTGTGDSTLIAGIVVSGSVPKRVLIRGVGPTLGALGVVGALAQPQLSVIKDGVTVASNSNWSTSPDKLAIEAASAQVGAFGLGSNSSDAAMILSLAPGNYSAQVVGANGTAGIAIIEIYELP
eukprot:TRINITY_DN7118_c0_g1_i1.p1 TRINITY_DN7118_c0_g1~~TRINITY_DN7118_c0_g1_i1.p1  ORF type:complete len:2111 (+),score=215.11 TRINITY_DN7118_c0_g1_i1:17-6349(+)